MKPSALTNAVIAGIAFAAGVGGDAYALNLNPLGEGQALIFPYYTVNAGNQTLITIVNRADTGKAVKVRFREGRNAREVLSFNLYLSPFDVWTAVAFSRSDNAPDDAATLLTQDNSCTVPRIKGNPTLPQLSNGMRYAPLSNLAFTGASNDAGPDTLDRTREGYFEFIEMGEVVNREHNSLAAITHGSTGVPANCLEVERAWLPLGAAAAAITYWSDNPLLDLNPPSGGLFGSVAIVDALAGTMMSYNADAIDGFSDIVQHTHPGAALPSLASARTTSTTAVAKVFSKGAMVSSTYPLAQAIDAVSALFMQDEIFNDFVTSASMGAQSEWVVTFPTKFAYTDEAIAGGAAIAPFTRTFPIAPTASNAGIAAVDMIRILLNRDGGPIALFCDDFFAPGCIGGDRQLDWASNVITFSQLVPFADPLPVATESRILGSLLVGDIPAVEQNVFDGWAALTFHATPAPAGSLFLQQRMRPDQSGGRWNGLPATGFWVASYTNGQLTSGVLSSYAGAVKHRGTNSYGVLP